MIIWPMPYSHSSCSECYEIQYPGRFALNVMPKIMMIVLMVSGIGTAYLCWTMF